MVYTFSIYNNATECMLNVFCNSELFNLASAQVSGSCCCPPPGPCSTAPAGLAGTGLSPHTSLPQLFSELEI